jgi:hypothetical protein
MLCSNCGSELVDGKCPNCAGSTLTMQKLEPAADHVGWQGTMFRYLLYAQALAGFMVFTTLPVRLFENDFDIDGYQFVFFLVLALAVISNVGMSFLSTKIGLFIAYLLGGQLLWLTPVFSANLVLVVGGEMSSEFLFRGLTTLEQLTTYLASSTGEYLYVYLVNVGFLLIGMAYLPFTVIGIAALAQETVSKNLSSGNEGKSSSDALAIGAFIAAFAAPIAGLVLALIGMRTWQETNSRNRGLLVSALAISIVLGLLSILLFTTVLVGPLFELLLLDSF